MARLLPQDIWGDDVSEMGVVGAHRGSGQKGDGAALRGHQETVVLALWQLLTLGQNIRSCQGHRGEDVSHCHIVIDTHKEHMPHGDH